MPIDTSIYANLLRPPKSIADYDAEAMAQQQNALALQMGRRKLQAYDDSAAQERAAAEAMQRERSALNALTLRDIDFGTDQGRMAVVRAAPTLGMKFLDDYGKVQQTYTKTRDDSAKARAEVMTKQVDMHNVLLRQVQNPQQAAQWMAAVYSDPELAPLMQRLGPLEDRIRTIPSDPQGFENWRLQASEGAKALRERLNAEAQTAETGRHNLASEATAQGQLGVARGNLGVAQGNLGQRRAEFAYGKEKDAAMLAKPEAVGKGDKPLTEGQAKAVAFASRMQNADSIVNDLAKDGTSVSVPGSRSSIIGPIVNAVSPAPNQQLDQAKRDFINAVLRRESGAVISDSEFDNAEKQYFPQIGDSSAVKKQKANNRRIAIEGMKADIPAGKLDQVDAIAGGKSQRGVPAPGAVENGYLFKGGDPSKSENWELVK